MNHFGASVLLVACFTAVPSAWTQQGTTQSAPKTAPSSPNLIPNKGSIDHGTYRNPSIGIELTPADNLHFKDPEIKGAPGTTPLVVTVGATEDGMLSGLFSPRSVMIFYADALAYYPAEQRNAARYANKVVRANEGDGYKIVNPAASGQLSGISVVRVDFVKGEVHEAVLITIHGAYAFVFIFAGSDFGVIDKSIASSKVSLAP